MAEDSASTRQAETRRLAAIMFTDIVGFSRHMGTDETRTLRLLAVRVLDRRSPVNLEVVSW